MVLQWLPEMHSRSFEGRCVAGPTGTDQTTGIAGVDVCIVRAGSRDILKTTTDANGEFNIQVPPGRYLFVTCLYGLRRVMGVVIIDNKYPATKVVVYLEPDV
jgi:hypothetical protein